MDYYFERYGDLDLQRRMVSDRWRTDAFARAIAAEVRPGDAVLDVGTGTGLLAMLCARAGAKRVHAIDLADVTQTAANLVKANGLSRKVKILRGAAGDLTLAEPVDLIVSEWLGNFAFVEAMLDDVIAARDRNLAPGGRMMPSHITALLAPADDPVLYSVEGPGGWRRSVHGLDFSSLEAVELDQGRATQVRIDPASLLAEGGELVSLDLAEAGVDDPWLKGSLQFKVARDGVLNGFAGWFVADLCEGIALDTSPYQPETHWAQTWLPFRPRVVRAGSTLKVDYVLERDPAERRHVLLTLKVGRVRQQYRLE